MKLIHFIIAADSLKKGVHNYINVVEKCTNGSFMPLMNNEVVFQYESG